MDGNHKKSEIIKQPLSSKAYLVISLLYLLICSVLFIALVFFQHKVNILLGERAYYIILFPLGFCTAGFFFGVMNSWATYHGNQINGTVQLGGPVVIGLLVIAGGFYFPRNSDFYYTISIKKVTDGQPLINYPEPRNQTLKLQLDDDWKEGLTSNGIDFDFKRLNGRYKNDKILIRYQGQFWSATTDSITLTGNTCELKIKPDGSLATISVVVKDTVGNIISGALVQCQGTSKVTDSLGRCMINMPLDKQRLRYQVEAQFERRTGLAFVQGDSNETTTLFIR
jgi:hypothetical protein